MDISPLTPKALAIKPAADANGEQVAESAKDFEAMFMGQMVDEMLSTIDIGSFGGGHAEETWRSFLSNAIGQSIADQSSTGIARHISSAMERYGTGRDL
ncbi:Rod binding protein [Loktanella atrilutea]|uniref:Rod binding protein n=1 Tax=Loktanella atrilutea TaxID=366533 RepID=A0A1M5C5Q8_LOKAT|nr:rod-binding protein [Loktanella atrilutea]SHF50055.1 Rod binding protein [Loktanella atrilutea]